MSECGLERSEWEQEIVDDEPWWLEDEDVDHVECAECGRELAPVDQERGICWDCHIRLIEEELSDEEIGTAAGGW